MIVWIYQKSKYDLVFFDRGSLIGSKRYYSKIYFVPNTKNIGCNIYTYDGLHSYQHEPSNIKSKGALKTSLL